MPIPRGAGAPQPPARRRASDRPTDRHPRPVERALDARAPAGGPRADGGRAHPRGGLRQRVLALHVARDLLPGGSLEIVDAQPQLLDAAIRGAREQRLVNVAATLGDARYLPYDTDEFDAAYLVAALGDAQDPDTAMRELARVVRPRGRVVVGELHGDPHRIGFTPAGELHPCRAGGRPVGRRRLRLLRRARARAAAAARHARLTAAAAHAAGGRSPGVASMTHFA